MISGMKKLRNFPMWKLLASVGGGQRFLHSKPDKHDRGKSDAHANPQSIDCGRRCGGQCVTSLCASNSALPYITSRGYIDNQ